MTSLLHLLLAVLLTGLTVSHPACFCFSGTSTTISGPSHAIVSTGTSFKMSSSSSTAEEELGQMRGGLIFVKTKDCAATVQFYQEKIDMKVWLEQPEITILSHGNLLIGFHNQSDLPPGGMDGIMYTFVYSTREEVDQMYQKFKDTTADGPPRENPRYKIYQFFAKDLEGRQLEFQVFLHPLLQVSSNVGDS